MYKVPPPERYAWLRRVRPLLRLVLGVVAVCIVFVLIQYLIIVFTPEACCPQSQSWAACLSEEGTTDDCQYYRPT